MPPKSVITLHLAKNYDKTLAPVPAKPFKAWWDDNKKTRDHAKHCLPLCMANSLGYYILSPGTFRVSWDGDVQRDCQITHIERSSHYEVDAHACFGSFVVQAKFIPRTENPGDFVAIRSLPNERDLPYHCMDAYIEAWWASANFGLVFLIHKPGEFIVQKGQPIAQMLLYKGAGGNTELKVTSEVAADHPEWLRRRTRKNYTKDLDYLQGLRPNGMSADGHIASWKQADYPEPVQGQPDPPEMGQWHIS